MADHPINFTAPMMIALLSGRKTQVRRLATTPFAQCRPGDHLWVRESFAPIASAGSGTGRWQAATARTAEHALLRDGTWRHRDGADAGIRDSLMNGHFGRRWWAPLAMPRWASRLTLVIEACRSEPLQAVTPEGARAEGVAGWPLGLPLFWRIPTPQGNPPRLSPVLAYRDIWDRLHGTPGECWADNPMVVALVFRVERRNIDQAPAA